MAVKKKWTPEYSIRDLPGEVRQIFLEEANSLLQSLKNNRLRVILVPYDDYRYADRKIRAVETSNPEWYQDLWLSHVYPLYKKPRYRYRSNIRRKRTLSALERIVNLKDQFFSENSLPHTRYRNDYLFRELICERLTVGYEEGSEFVLPDNKVREYFGLEPVREIKE